MKSLKITRLLCALLLGILTWNGCKKDDPDPNDKGPDCNLSNADLSYTKNIKGIIDTYCIGCHSGAGPGVGDWRTYEGLKSRLDNGLVLQRVVIDKDMPQAGGMPQAQRDSINCWIKSGYPK